MEVTGNTVRSAMTKYWEEHSQDATLEEMMLDSSAHDLCKEEEPEIISYLPNLKSKDVVELGAGIGRYTTLFAEKSKSVIAVDFMQKFLNKNMENNCKFNNIEYTCADVTKLQLLEQSTDLLFSNWLLMYLEDEEIQDLLRSAMYWLREDGYFFCRESCFHQSGDKPRQSNPTNYRDPALYEAIFNSVTLPSDEEGQVYGFDLVFKKPLTSYVRHKKNNNQIVWLLQKVKRQEQTHGFVTFREFLDNQQYSKTGVLRYEKIFGRTFISTGGFDTTKNFVSRLNLKPGQKVLDVGCGIGGSAFYMARDFDVKVVGIDLSSNMISLALERREEVGISVEQVEFEVADATKREYPPHSFDVVYSRDTILHINDKLGLLKRFFKVLKPGGIIFISDYCCSEDEHTEAFKAYVKQRGYNLLTPKGYGKVLEDAGFVQVKAEDRTDLFIQSLKNELVKFETIKEEFVQEFSLEDYDYLVQGWNDKLVRTSHGDQRWGVFYAVKPHKGSLNN